MDEREELIQLACSLSDKTDMYCWSDIKSASNETLEAMIEEMEITISKKIKGGDSDY